MKVLGSLIGSKLLQQYLLNGEVYHNVHAAVALERPGDLNGIVAKDIGENNTILIISAYAGKGKVTLTLVTDHYVNHSLIFS